jgi:putative SOS response-associated peptidase YedK
VVDISRLPLVGETGPSFAMGSDAREASRTAGTQMVERRVAWLADKAKQLVADFDKKAPVNRRLEPMRWGLVPSWAKDAKIGFPSFNARADSVIQSSWPSRRRSAALRRRRGSKAWSASPARDHCSRCKR